jgi:hypothetical protein
MEPMDQISIRTPYPKCRLYWCLIEFIDWRYIHLSWYFRPPLFRLWIWPLCRIHRFHT